MRLAYLANIRLPTEKAHGIQIMKTCEALADLGHEVTLVVPRRRNFIKEDPFEYHDVARNFSIRRIPVADFLALPFLKQLGFFLETVSFVKSLLWHLRPATFDAYYTRDLAVAAGLRTKTPLFYEIHSLPGRSTWLHRRAWKRAKGVVVISKGLRKALITRGVAEEKILLARDAVDIKKFQIATSRAECRAKLNLPADKNIIVYAGHLYAWKGVSTLADAAPFTPDAEIYIVGGTYHEVALLRVRCNAPNVHIVGWQNPALIPYWLKAADVLVIPNSAKEPIGAAYTSPLKLFEYMASGVPIVASRVPAIAEIVEEDEVVFVQPDDAHALAAGITQALQDTERAARMAKQAAVRVMEYTWENRAKRIADFITQMP